MKSFINCFNKVKKDYAQCYGAIQDLCKQKILEIYNEQFYVDNFRLYDTKTENDTVIAYVSIDLDGSNHVRYHEFKFTDEDFKDFMELYDVKFQPYNNRDKRCKMTIEEFICGVQDRWITDDDGCGYFATDTEVSNKEVFFDCDDAVEFPKWATHVVWYNK